ncbi:MAG TPA: PAS domain-containing sensor histidine kinase [Xanthobacteraceae bacterium]|jgi:two-component system nitrogen regulation sensor histidine kinase NtrY|nr:PAS domain-containing sensor histidine kinase [Xanthobacteraceae bacterium]
MTSVGQAATTELLTSAAAPPSGWIPRALGVAAVALALFSALVTFVVLAGLTPIAPTHEVVVTLLLANAGTVFLLVLVIAREVWGIVQARRRGRAAARLHVRIVALFSIIAAVPAILVAVVASVTLDRGLDRLFSQQTRSLIENSLIVSDAYVREHVQFVRADSIAIAIELARAKPLFDQSREQFHQFLAVQASIRGLPAVMLLDKDVNVIDQVDARTSEAFVKPSPEVLAAINDTEPQVAMFLDDNYVAAIIKLRGYDDIYLYIARLLDPRVLAQLRATQASVAQYADLSARRIGIQIAFALMYTVIALIVLLSAVWIGLNFANYLVAPIRRLIGAAQVVSTGNLYVQVPTRRSEGDLAQLGETFNKMTQELRTQRDDIVRARDLIDSRRRFTEAVLAGASAGVIGVDADSCISIMNRSAEQLIGRTEADVLGQPLAEVVPELAGMLEAARSGTQRLVQGQVTISRNGRERNLSVRATSEQSGAAEGGYVMTLDDITELVAAQRTSAWADVARRIAHEIKNPLTPIQLSAERLRRKYGSVIKEDGGVFQQCTDTIVRQVDDIKRMVDEFSRFARMPKPVMTAEDVADTVRQVVFLQRVGNADMDIDLEIAEDPMPAKFDRRLISQALTNIIKNATEAIAAVPPAELGRGRIRIWAGREGGDIVVDVVDNGIGLPKENRSRLLEPYVTTREKGTGLGLAIVGRILEDHGGRIELGDAADKIPGQRGAWMRLRFAAEVASSDEADTAPQSQTPQLATNA